MAGHARQQELLEALADTPPAAYLQRGGGGESLLRELHEQAAEAGLAAAAAADDIARLHALFDVALDHGLGGLVRDYLAEVCCDRSLASSDPVQAFLLDAECVRRWVVKALAVSRGRLAGWLARGLGAPGGTGLLAKELGRLQMLQLVAEGLQQPPAPHDGGAAGAAAEQDELGEARRLVTCARALSWLGGAARGLDRPAGRFFSEQEWRSVAAKRREGAAAVGVGGLFQADLASELARQGVPEASLAYPPPSPDRLLAALLLGPAGGGAAAAAAKPGGKAAAAPAAAAAAPPAASLDARLALLAYYLADGGFLPHAAIVQGLGTHYNVPPATAHAWLLQQLLDDSHTGDAAGGQSLARAAELVPAVDGARLPHKALQVFAARGQLAAALALLRQRPESSVKLDEASVALSVRLQNGLLGEAFMGLHRHLAAVTAAAPPAAAPELSARHARLLVAQLLRFTAATTPSAVHAAMRLPFGGVEEEAVVEWLEGQAGSGRMEAALMLPLYFLLRGRTPEALHAYARHCPRTPASQQQLELQALLTEAARMLPAPQRALVVQHGSAPALLPAGASLGGEESGGLPLMAGIPAVATDAAPALLSVGPTPAQAPLVGSVPVLLEQQRREAAAAAAAADAAGSAGGAKVAAQQQPTARAQQQQQPAPMLFGQLAPAGGARASGAPLAPAFGALAAAAPADEAMLDAAGAPAGGGSQHEFDRVVGSAGGAFDRAGAKAKSKRRWGGSAYR